MVRYKVILAYDGTAFYGSQRQAEARTVQSEFEVALRKLGWQGQSVILAGRTDSGVHATGQVAAFDLNWKHPSQALVQALNSLLPKDISVRSAEECADDFHPRFDAVWRSYSYSIICDPVRDPITERFAWRVWPAPDLDLMQATAGVIMGTHDFSSFGRPTRPNGSTIRQVFHAGWKQAGNKQRFDVTANAFLYHMVRRMVFVLVSCGLGKHTPEEISQVLQYPQNHPVFQGLAPAQGLSLIKVGY
jgi:tRNA pseudouridine38-40 synthase